MVFSFRCAEAFNSELAWDTSSVTIMEATFQWAEAFNRQLDWDVASATTFYRMFHLTALASDADASQSALLAWHDYYATGDADLAAAYLEPTLHDNAHLRDADATGPLGRDAAAAFPKGRAHPSRSSRDLLHECPIRGQLAQPSSVISVLRRDARQSSFGRSVPGVF